eukprot:GILI01015688.1.p1 GENE.GILI01015688.1~~GILI01015688.1.p1  ORF type:complete len:196 (-),score=30.02 GILI01015688.1:35-622(-)
MSYIDTYFGVHDSSLELLLHPPSAVIDGLDVGIAEAKKARDSGKRLTEDDKFSLAAMLVSHADHGYVKEGVDIMEQLLYVRWSKHEKLVEGGPQKWTEEEEKRELAAKRKLASYLLYASIGRCKLGQYDMAYSTARKLASIQPDDRQGAALLAYVERMQTREGVAGLAGLAGIAAVAGVGIAAVVAVGVRALSKK